MQATSARWKFWSAVAVVYLIIITLVLELLFCVVSERVSDENPVIEFKKRFQSTLAPTLMLHNIDSQRSNEGEVVVTLSAHPAPVNPPLLRCINKLEEITSGDLIVDGPKVNDPKVDDRLIRQEAQWCSSSSICSRTSRRWKT